MRNIVNHFRRFAMAGLCLGILLPAFPGAVHGETVVTAVGDIMLAGSAARVVASRGYGYPFAAVREVLQGADITIGNLEAPITGSGVEFTDKKFRFRTPPSAAAALKDAGFSLLTLANNHTMDFGEEGLRQTLSHLRGAGIAAVGAGENLASARKPAVFEAAGSKVAFLAYSLTFPAEFYAAADRSGTAPGYLAFFRDDIRKARQWADYVVVSFHWGGEGETEPKQYQIAAAHAAVDAGADAVIGHHPHVLQGIEMYRGRPVFYSLGNFIFGSMSRVADLGCIARLRFSGKKVSAEVIPLNVANREVRFRPVPLTGEKGRQAISRLAELSGPFGTVFAESGEVYRVIGAQEAEHVSAFRGH